MSRSPKSYTHCAMVIAGHCWGLGHPWHRGRQGKALYPTGQCVIVLMWFYWYFMFKQKPNHISTDCHMQT